MSKCEHTCVHDCVFFIPIVFHRFKTILSITYRITFSFYKNKLAYDRINSPHACNMFAYWMTIIYLL